MKARIAYCLICALIASFFVGYGQPSVQGSAKPLTANQQDFVNLQFGMFIHFNIPTFMDEDRANIKRYRLEYQENGEWKTLLSGGNPNRIKIHSFNRVWGDKVRMRIDESANPPAIAEFGVYNERR